MSILICSEGERGDTNESFVQGFILTKPEEALPRYAPKAPPERAHPVDSSGRRRSTHPESHKETDPGHHEADDEAEEEAEEQEEEKEPESPTPKFKSSAIAL